MLPITPQFGVIGYIGMADSRADRDQICVDGDRLERGNARHVDQLRGLRETQPHGGQQALTAGEKLGVAVGRNGCGGRLRIRRALILE